MKNIIFLNQTNYNDSLVGPELIKLCQNGVFLDGNWCCYNKDLVHNETCQNLVLDNLVYLINNFILSNQFDNIVVGWKFKEGIIDKIVPHLNSYDYLIYHFQLTNTNQADVIDFQLVNKEYEKNYYIEKTSNQIIKESKLDTTNQTSFKIALEIKNIIEAKLDR
ncbi:MAG: hypothetical protein ACI4WG_06380 [Erysipelotrichaceae bacterium]